MIKKAIAALLFVSTSLYAQRIERLIETRSVSNHEIVGAEHDAATNSLFILANVSESNGNGLLVKVNAASGDTLWSKFVAPSVQQENFKGLYKSANALFAYGLRSFQSAQYAFIAKLDFNGDTLWTKHFKTLATTSCTNPLITINGLTELANGDLVMVGRNNACDRAVLLKTNSLGVVSLIKEYDQWVQGGGGAIREFYGIVGDGTNYYVSARYDSQQNFKGIWKLDLNGNLVTNYTSQFAQNSEILGLKKDIAGNFYLLGQHYPFAQGVGILEKFNASGTSQWTYSPTATTIQWSGITDLEFDNSGDVYVSGFFQKQNQSVDQFAAKINATTGAEVWLKQYGYGDNGYGRELVKLGSNFILVSDEQFGWDSRDQYGVLENAPTGTPHPVIQVFNASGQVGKFKKSPWQDSKRGKSQFFAYAAISFSSSYWSNVNLVPVTLASATGGTSGFNAWNNNYNFEIWMSSQNQNGNGAGTFYFTAADKNGDVRSSDTLEVLQPSSFSGEDIYGSIAVAACSGDSLKLVPSVLNTGSTYKWLYFGTSGTATGVKVGTGLNVYAKQKGYYALREVLANLDSAQSNTVLLTIETDRVKITSSAYPQKFWVAGSASDTTSKSSPSLTDWSTNKHLHQWVAPFGRYRQSNVQQYYYSASELSSRGLSAGSKISEIAFELAESYSGGSLEDFKIAFRWTTASTNAWITFNSSDIVFDNYWQNPSTSTGSLSFDINDQTWNGTSSLMVQVSYRVNSYTATDINPVFKLESSSMNSSRVLFAQNNTLVLIGNTGAGNKTFMYRPLTRFKIGYPAKTDTIVSCETGIALSIQNTGYQALTWNNGATASTRQITSPSLVYVTMVDGNFCVSQDTVRVIFNPNTNQIVSSALKVGPGGTISLSAQPRSINLWSNGASGNTTTVTSSGKYKLTSINSDGCTYTDSVTVEVLKTPVVYKGDRGAYRGTPLTGFTYMGKIGTSHVYYSNSCKSWNNAVQNVTQLGAKFWYPKSAADNAAIKSLYNSKISWSGGKWIGVYRPTTSSAWRDLSGNPVTYTNWDINYNQNGLYGFIEFSWSGFWNASTDGTNECREFFIAFDDASSVAAANETVCDSLKLWTPEGFDSYQWTLGTTNLTTTANEIWAKNTGVYAVKGIYGTTTYNGSNTVSLTVNTSPSVAIINKSGTVDLNGSNSIKLKATYPAGSTVTWYVNGVAQTTGQDSVISNVVGWHRVVVVNNGCMSQDSVKLSQPIYVAKTGNDATGNGTLSSPYLTIQKGVNVVAAGGKVYVLPGVYTENIQISKQLELRSDYDRLTDTNALHTTVINGGGLSLAVQLSNYTSSTSTIISGFTIKNGYNSNSEGAGVKLDNVQGAPVYLTNVKLTENARQCCSEGISFTQVGGSSVLENVRFINNGSPTFWDERREVTLRAGASSKWNRIKYSGNATQFDVISIMDGSKLEISNSLFFNNEPQNGDHGLFGIHNQLSELTLNHVTIWSNNLSSHSNQYVIKNHGTQQVVRIVNSVIDAGADKIVGLLTGNQLYVRNSVLNGALVGTGPIDSLRVLRKPAFVLANGALASTSPAVGHARPVSSLQGVSFVNSATDFIGQSRPNPTGSFADAGAMESPLAQGDFGLDIKNCGWNLTANILNSSNYTVQWSGPNGYSSSANSITVPQLGTYAITVISLDRLDTLTVSSVVQDPLRASITTRDVCLAAGLNSGYFDIRNVTGGTPYSVANQPTHKWGLRKGATYIQGPNGGLYASSFWWNSNLTSGSYVVELSDASGCTVEYPFTIAEKARRTAFVSTTGNDSNAGTRQSPYRTVAAAVSNACGLDSIVVLDGVYSEDSIFVSKPLVIGSEFILDGNISHIGGTKFLNSEDATFFYGGINTTTGDTINSQLVGLTIEGGQNPHVDQWYGHGGAISVWNSVVKMNRLVLKNNTAKDGGAIGLMGHGFTAVVANCTIDGNTAYNSGGGLTANLTGDLWIRNTSFTNNTANSGGGIWNQSNLVMSDVRIEGNSAQNSGGFWSSTISPWSSGTKKWARVIVRNNVANVEFGGGYFQKSGSNSQFILENALIVDNAAQNYPGIHFGGYDDNRISIVNSTIYGNVGSGSSQAAKNNIGFGDNTRVRLLNSIVGRSGDASGYTFYATNCGTKYLMADASSVIVGGATSIFEDNCGGQLVKSLTGIKTAVPYFNDPANGDYSLKSFSSLIGAGLASNALGITSVSPNIAPLTLTAPTRDVFNASRPLPVGSSVDIGAIESALGVGVPGINVTVVSNGTCQTANGSATVNLVQVNGQPTGTPNISWLKLGDPSWTPQTTTTISNLAAGNYEVTLTVGTTVFKDTAVVATAPSMSIVNSSVLTNCFGGNDGTLKFSIQGGTPFTGGTYKYNVQQLTKDGGVATWTDNSTQERSANFMSTPRTSGTYRISVTDAKGCQFVDTITLGYRNTLPVAQIVASGPLTICQGETVSLVATTANSTDSYSWNDGSNLSVNSVGTSGNWVITVTDTAGCAASDSVLVDVKLTPTLMTGTAPAHTGGALTGYTYLGVLNGNHYYYSSGISANYNTAKQNAVALGGTLWKVDNATEHQTVRNWITGAQGCCWAVWTGAEYGNGWKWSDGTAVTYNSFYPTVNPSNGQAARMHLGDGNWDADNNGAQYAYIVEFSNGARMISTSETFCDSVTVWAPVGYDTYVWKNTANNNAVVGTARSLTLVSSMALKVEATLVKSNGTSCTLESSTSTITINQTPSLNIVNLSNKVDIDSTNVKLFASRNVQAPIQWYRGSSLLGNSDTLTVSQQGFVRVSVTQAGCTASDSIMLYKPIFVAKTGNNSTGTGSFTSPFKTIQHAINQSIEGGKIYVLPGVYTENVTITKPVQLLSNYNRLNNKASIASTVINSADGNFTVKLDASTGSKYTILNTRISGFTLTGKNSSGHESALSINAPTGNRVLVDNLKISGNTQGWGWTDVAAALKIANGGGALVRNVEISGNNPGALNNPNVIWISTNSDSVVFDKCTIKDNFASWGLFNMANAHVRVQNSLIHSNKHEDMFRTEWSNSKVLIVNSTLFAGVNTNNSQIFRYNTGSSFVVVNSIIGLGSTDQLYLSGGAGELRLKNSIINKAPGFWSGSTLNVSLDSTFISKDFDLLPNFNPGPAFIGLGRGSSQFNWQVSPFAVTYSAPTSDLLDSSRSNPIGTKPDIGAIESSRSIGDLRVLISACGNDVFVEVQNSYSFVLEWNGPNGFTSSSDTLRNVNKGLYTLKVISSDRGDTVFTSFNLQNPLTFDLLNVKDVCEGVSTTSGSFSFGGVQGGIANVGTWWTHKFRVLTLGGQVLDGWDLQANSNWTYTRNNAAQGSYIIEVTDGSGCSVRDTVVVNGQPSATYFIATTGSDTATGSATQPLKTISEALNRACDGDTVILEDGRHFENVVMSSTSPKVIISSRYILDGDTNHIRNAIVDGMDLNPVFSINMNNQGASDTIKLNGFTVTHGLANSGWNGGGGISIRNANVSVTNMRIIENNSGQHGGGMGVWESQIKLKNVLIKDNFATSQGGGLHLQYVNNDLIQTNVRIQGNRASEGGGLYYARSLDQTGQVYELDGFTVVNNLATQAGGGIYFSCWSGSAAVQLSNSKVIGNRATQAAGGISVSSTNANFNLVNVVISRNEANEVGGIRVNNSKLNLIHSTVFSNRHILGSTSPITNIAIRAENQSTVKLFNSILGGQGAGGKNAHLQDNSSLFDVVSGQLEGGLSTVQAPTGAQATNSAAAVNYSAQQVFLKDPNGGDFGLAPVSQAIGRGLTAFSGSIPFPMTDLYGANRPNMVGSKPDFGAIESSDTSAVFGVAFVINDNNACNTSIGQITAFPQNGSGQYTYSWTALTSGGIISNPTGSGASHTIANLFTGQYQVVVTDIGVTPNKTTTAVASVRGDSPILITKTVKNEGCQGANDGSFEINVSGGSGFYTYTWLKPGGATSNTKNLLNIAPGIYTVTVTDNKGCSVNVTDTVGTSFAKPNVVVTSQISKAGGTVVAGGSDVRMCVGDQVVFNAGAGYGYYEWNKSDGLNPEYTQTVSSTVSQNYTVYVEDTNGCSASGTAKVFVVYEPNVYASNVNRTMGQQFQQVTSYVRGDTTTTSNFTNSNVSPYNATMGGGVKRMQFVISASELQSAGLTENTTINSLAFDVVNPNGAAVQAYKVKLAHTTAQQLGTWQSPADQTETFAIPVYSPVQGWNTHNFSNSFAWNGVDNLLIEVCYAPAGSTMSNSVVRVNRVSAGTMLSNFSYGASSCSGTINQMQMGTSIWRPAVRFGIDKVEVLDTVRVCDFTTLNTTDDYDTYTWYVNGVANTTAGLSLNLTTPANVYLAATDAASNCVMRSDTFYVALDATPNVVATSNTTGAVCAGDTVVLGTTSLGLASYAWSNGDSTMTTNVFESGTYVLQARSINGCAGDDTVVVAVNTPPTVVVKLNGKTLTATDGTLASKASTCVQSVLLPVNENFEDSLYIWTQSSTDQLDWTFNSGVTNTQFSGPNGDYTTSDSSGNYYYLDRAGANSDDNKEAHLLSPCIQLVGAKKPYLAFGYHMYNGLYNPANPASDNMGTLRIEVQTTDDAANYWLPLWTKTGHQGAGWKDDTLNLTAFAGKTIRLRIVGKAGVGGPRSEMAIDGFTIVDTANAFANVAGRISADIICEGDVLIADAISNGSTNFNYLWSTGDTTSTIKVDTTGYYFVTVLDENGCSISTDSVWINVSPIPNSQLTVTGDLNNCYNETVAVTVQAPSSYEAYTWFGDTALTPNNATTTLVSVQGVAIGQYALGVRIVDSIGCAALSDTVRINRYVQPSITYTTTPANCYGDSTGSITVVPASGQYSFNWNTGDTTATAAGLQAGMYQVIFTDANGCVDTNSISVGQPTALNVVNSVTDVLCNDDLNGSLNLNVSGSVSPYWLDWSTTGVDSSLTRVTLTLDMRSASSINNPTVSIVGVASNIPMVSYHNDSIYYVTVERKPGTPIYYRFFNGSTPELVPISCGVNPPSLTTPHRSLVTGVNDTTIKAVCFASCVDCFGQNSGAKSQALISSNTTISNQGNGIVSWTIVDANGCVIAGQDTINEPQPINVQLDTIVDVSCPQAGDGSVLITVSGGTLPFSFDWSNGDTIEDILNENEGSFDLIVTDNNGCLDSAQFEIGAPTPFNFEEICMMTVDSLTGKNQVVWNKTPAKGTMEYHVFKETNVAGQYAQIGTVPYLSLSVFTDVNSVPQQQPDRYKIAVVDSCGNMSDTSDLHRTIHLQSSFGSGGEVNLAWTQYEGRSVQTYDIYRWVSAGNVVQIGSVSGATNTFSDLNPPVAPNVYYNVRAIFSGDACAPSVGKNASYEAARSNILNQTGIGLPDLPWKGMARMYPNPTNGLIQIEVPQAGFVVKVTNLLGQVVYQGFAPEATLGLDLGFVSAGMYQVELYQDGQIMSIDKLHVVH